MTRPALLPLLGAAAVGAVTAVACLQMVSSPGRDPGSSLLTLESSRYVPTGDAALPVGQSRSETPAMPNPSRHDPEGRRWGHSGTEVPSRPVSPPALLAAGAPIQNPEAFRQAAPTRKELIKRAHRLEAQANRQLAYYTENLGLSEAQQDVAFPMLARSSGAFHPSFFVEGAETTPSLDDATTALSDPGSPDPAERATTDASDPESNAPPSDPEEDLYDILDEEQQDDLEELAISRDDWWTDVIDFLADDTDAADVPEPVDIAGTGDITVTEVAPLPETTSSGTPDSAPAGEDTSPSDQPSVRSTTNLSDLF